MNLFQCKQQTTDGIDSLSDQQVTIILRRRRRRRKEVSYNDMIHVIPNNSIKNDQRTISMSQLWYSREELSCLRREFAVLSKHYKKLTSRQYFNQDELLGLEDADMSRTRSNTRKAVLKLVLFEQERQRSFDTVDPIQIAKMLASHSILAHQEALERAAKCFFGCNLWRQRILRMFVVNRTRYDDHQIKSTVYDFKS